MSSCGFGGRCDESECRMWENGDCSAKQCFLAIVELVRILKANPVQITRIQPASEKPNNDRFYSVADDE
jgi:hypothetical protein